jgi:AraC-like DNA-binding protein
MGRLFRRHLGCTPLAYVQRTQMEHAARLLATTDLPAKEIGRQVGIGDPYYFSKLFRKVRGETATAYRHRAALLSRG